jgi:hypothetical protein
MRDVLDVTAAPGNTMRDVLNVTAAPGNTMRDVLNVTAASGNTMRDVLDVTAAPGNTMRDVLNVTAGCAWFRRRTFHVPNLIRSKKAALLSFVSNVVGTCKVRLEF